MSHHPEMRSRSLFIRRVEELCWFWIEGKKEEEEEIGGRRGCGRPKQTKISNSQEPNDQTSVNFSLFVMESLGGQIPRKNKAYLEVSKTGFSLQNPGTF